MQSIRSQLHFSDVAHHIPETLRLIAVDSVLHCIEHTGKERERLCESETYLSSNLTHNLNENSNKS